MRIQLHKRLSQSFVEEALEAFNEHRLNGEKLGELLAIKRDRLTSLWSQGELVSSVS